MTSEVFRALYLALVWPNMKYELEASSPYLRRDIYLMDCLQRLATRMVKPLRALSYEERLHRLNLFTTERRLFRRGLILSYSLLQGRLNVPLEEICEAPAERNFRR